MDNGQRLQTFLDLAASRRAWIEQVLKPWCAQASVAQLKLAELEWVDIAGKVDPEATLWAWAWGRFPGLVNADLGRIDEARQVTVELHDGRKYTGFPDARESRQGGLVLLCRLPDEPKRFANQGPFALEAIASVSAANAP